MSEPDFWACTPRYFAARQKAFALQQQREWERARFVGWISILPHLSLERRIRITDICLFDWEKAPAPKFEPVDKAELQRAHNAALDIFEKQFGLKRPEPIAAHGHH